MAHVLSIPTVSDFQCAFLPELIEPAFDDADADMSDLEHQYAPNLDMVEAA